MVDSLSKRAEQLFIDDVLVADWDATNAVGFDLGDAQGTEGFLPVAPSLDDVGEIYPHITIQRTNETSGGETTYDAISDSGPAQNRTGQLLATARAEERESDVEYVGDSATYSAVDAAVLVDMLIDEVEDVCQRNHLGGGTDFSYLGSQRGADAPDDFDVSPPVRTEQCTIAYGWLREP